MYLPPLQDRMDIDKKKLKRLTLTEMERQLLNDKDGSYRREILQKIAQYQQWVEEQIATGLAPGELSVYEQLKNALDSAHEIIISFK
ncbi:MAG: hypothetical protein LBF44_00455 [Holosporaceae bacterium]|jgi:hypothetical protein|nr:hypothetical protein [Holosporaceae bacterium]